MKRLLVVLLVCVIVLSAGAALTEDANFKSLSDDELILLLNQVQAEIAARRIEKTALLQAGKYVGGRDIPAGSYVLTGAGFDEQFGIVSLRSVNDPLDDYPSKLYDFTQVGDHYTVYVTIEDGDTLELPYPFNLTISGGLMFK